MGQLIKLSNETYIANDLYSTNEIEVGKFIDGKPLYRKVISGRTPNDNTPTIIGNIPNVQWISKIEGFLAYYNQRIPLNFVYNTEQISCYSEYGNIMVRNTSTTYRNCECHIIVEYTKSTD